VAPHIGNLQFFRTASALTLLFLLLTWETFAPFFPLFTNGGTERARHGARNLFLGLFNAAITSLAIVAVWSWVAREVASNQIGVLNWAAIGPSARMLPAILLFDLWMYWWHRANHRLVFFWRFHRTHHSDPKMDVTTAHRFHFGEILLSSLFRIPVLVVLGLQLRELAIYETLMFAVVQLHHANVALPEKVDRVLRWIIVTPSIHKVHHSRFQPETDSNYSSVFSLWDRLFRTLKLRADPATIRFGLDGFDGLNRQTIAGMLKTPLETKTSPPQTHDREAG
jgi:sterol desaturase/sphingolipid hydroxylase (fatty acid hydroxylase superfamily)